MDLVLHTLVLTTGLLAFVFARNVANAMNVFAIMQSSDNPVPACGVPKPVDQAFSLPCESGPDKRAKQRLALAVRKARNSQCHIWSDRASNEERDVRSEEWPINQIQRRNASYRSRQTTHYASLRLYGRTQIRKSLTLGQLEIPTRFFSQARKQLAGFV